MTGDDFNISATKKSSGVVQERNITLVNTPNLQENDLPDSVLHKELRKAVCFACPGPHAVVFVVDPLHLTSDTMDILKPMVHYFGERILKHTLIVYHERGMRARSIEDEVKRIRALESLLRNVARTTSSSMEK